MNLRRLLLCLTWALLVACGGAHAAPPQVMNVVLVHGALVDGSSWRRVHDLLSAHGFRVSIVQQPQTGFDNDVAATRRVLERQDGPVVLVGHSYGGSIITVAGTDPKVKALVYVAAIQPDAGETSTQAAPPRPSSGAHFQLAEGGYVFLDPAHFVQDIAADVPPAQARFMAHAQMPILAATFDAKVPVAAWRDKPSYAVIATDDRALDPERARWMAQRAGSKVTYVKGSHLVHVSQPDQVAHVIERAAREAAAR